MMKDVERGHITGLIFSKLARLGRNTRELLDFSDFFQKHDADLISLQESIDTSTPAGRLFYTMIAAMAHWEREEIASRVSASVPIRAKLGKPLGGQAPFGYMWKDKKLVVDGKEAALRRLIYDLFLEHKRKKTVARKLNEMGHRMRGGTIFYDSTIERLIEDPTAKGLHRTNYTTNASGKKGWTYKPEDEWIYAECEAIISEELWIRCNQILAEQRSKRKPPAKKAVQLFGGLTWCVCGQKMYVPSNTPKYVCQKCRNKLPVVDLEEIFIEQLKGFFLSPTEIAKYLEQADRTIQGKNELLGVLESELSKLRQEMDKVFQLYMQDKITPDGFGLRYRPHEARLAQLNEEIPRLQAELDYLKVNLSSSDEILHQARDLYGRWPQLSHEDKRQIVETITERITIGNDEITIDLFYLPTASGPLNDPSSNPTNGSDPTPPRKPTQTLTPFRSEFRNSSELVAKGQPTGTAWPT